MKKDFCIDCKFPIVRRLEKGHSAANLQKTCKGCTRIVAPRASRKSMRSPKK
ncbi:MAG: hypothetical protein Q7S19_01825 [bacterium]|nr:hypothetical protein [bacterium]